VDVALFELLSAQAPSGAIELTFDGNCAAMTLRHSEKRNAMSASMMLDLRHCVERLTDWQGSLLILRGESGHFCAGADLRLVRGALADANGGRGMCAWMTELLNAIYTAPYVSVAVIEGVALGGGAELATATDFRLLSTKARLQFVHAKRGLSPGWGGASRLVDLVGRRRALYLLASAEPVLAHDAMNWGLVDGVFEEGSSASAIERFVAPMLSHSAQAVRANKLAVVSALREGLSSPGEAEAFAGVWPPVKELS
jgi:ethylmalonyl-CoA/methylmalonyl-CoA decarboxylase